MKVSVALCTYNGEQFLREQLDSILNQTLAIDEIIICDDKSTDATISILKEYKEKYPTVFFIYENENTLRSVKNFEQAISLCTGDIIFLSDQDDIWVDIKVEKYCTFFNENPSIQVLASNGYCINEKSETSEKYSLWDIPEFLKEQNIKIDYFKTITHLSNIATGATMALRKSFLPQILPFPSIKDLHHDEWIAMIASSKNAFELLNEKYFYYRIHENQQVGSVFHHKTIKKKQYLKSLYDITNDELSYSILKKRLKRLHSSFHKNRNLQNFETKFQSLFEENGHEIENKINATYTNMKLKFPIKTFLKQIGDKISNKQPKL